MYFLNCSFFLFYDTAQMDLEDWEVWLGKRLEKDFVNWLAGWDGRRLMEGWMGGKRRVAWSA